MVNSIYFAWQAWYIQLAIDEYLNADNMLRNFIKFDWIYKSYYILNLGPLDAKVMD